MINIDDGYEFEGVCFFSNCKSPWKLWLSTAIECV